LASKYKKSPEKQPLEPLIDLPITINTAHNNHLTSVSWCPIRAYKKTILAFG